MQKSLLRGWMGIACLAMCSVIASKAVAQQAQGVSRSEIVVGTIQDLSGPLAVFGKAARNGMKMRANEVNDQGGVNGRHIRLVVEDSGFDIHRAESAALKLTNTDRVFAVLGDLGTAQNLVAMPIQVQKGVINFFPLTGARETYEPASKLKMAFMPSYYDQIRTAVPYLFAHRKYQHICAIYQEDEFGQEVLHGTEQALKAVGLSLADKVSFPHAITDISAQISGLKAANCELVILGTLIRETVLVMNEARKEGFIADFVGTSAVYSQLVLGQGGKNVEGLYGVSTISYPYSNDASKLVRDWIVDYRAKFNEEASAFSVYGYYIMDIFTKAAARAGPNLTVETINSAMESTTFPRDMFGAPEFHISPSDRLGTRRVRISQVQSGRWVSVTALLDPPSPLPAPG